jgi:hypothetical protein
MDMLTIEWEIRQPEKPDGLPSWWPRWLRARLTVWLALGLMVASGTALGELSQLLADITTKGEVSYSASVFTSVTFVPFESAQNLADALRLWCPAHQPTQCHLDYVYLHLAIDLFAFASSAAYLGYRLIVLVGLGEKAWWIPLALFGVDVAETGSTWWVVGQSPDDAWYVLPRILSDIKWAGFAGALVVVVAAWASGHIKGTIGREHVGLHGRTVAKLAGPIAVLAFFLALIALPAGGPLDQLPDVLRNHVSAIAYQGDAWPLLGSVLGLLLFFLALLVAAEWTTHVPAPRTPRCPPKTTAEHCDARRTRRILVGALVISLGICLVKVVAEMPAPWVGLAPIIVVGGLWAVDGAVRKFGLRPAGDKVATRTPAKDDLARSWMAFLPALAVMGSGVGLLRATFKPLVLGMGLWPWLVGFVVALLVTVGGGALTEMLCRRVLEVDKKERNWKLGAFQRLAVVLLVPIAAVLMIWPSTAAWLTSGGTIAVCLAVFALLFGLLHYLGQHGEPWGVTARLRLGRLRTPWVGMTVATWLLASALNTVGGYHDIHVFPDSVAARYQNPSEAVESWLALMNGQSCTESAPSEPIKLIMVAAPGGGIRASYWTSSALDAMTATTACGAQNIFAVSGVSGGSVGAAAWLASPPGKARKNVTRLATDNALAASTAALFLRDIPQPFLGVRDSWHDRSAVMEDEWASQAPEAFGNVDQPRSFSSLGVGPGWRPVVMFNGSSVLDGCRVLVTNVMRLPAGPSPCEPTGGSGPLPGSLDALKDLRGHLGSDGKTCAVDARSGGRGDISLATAALLSARFPVISSSGVLARCAESAPRSADAPWMDQSGRVRRTYDVDGGYYENTGLLSLLQLWESIRPTVLACNSQAGAPAPAGTATNQPQPAADGHCPTSRTGSPLQIQPWIVVLDNHYESQAAAAPTPRQQELTLPVQAVLNASDIVGQANLEESARIAMQNFTFTASDGAAKAGRFARIGPSKRPTVEAPLGWVLSQTARCGLDRQLQDYKPRVDDLLDPARVQRSDDCTKRF